MSISIKLNEQKQIKKISFNNNETLTTGELFDVATSFLGLTVISILKQTANRPNYTEEQSKSDRAMLYDALVAFVSGLANEIYPENEEIKGTPEDFLSHLEQVSQEIDEKMKKLNKIQEEANVTKQ